MIKVLLVEDNPGDVRLLQAILAEVPPMQFELTQVERLSETLKYLSQESFDVVLLDLSLPDSQGLEALVKLQSQVPQVPVVVLTGLEDETLAVRAVHEGAQDYLFKGQVNGDLLARSIRYAIERKRSEEALRQQVRREQLVGQIAQHIRQSLNLEETLNTTVSEVRQFLGSDRVFVYRFRPDWSGVVVIEATDSRWEPLQGRVLTDPSFADYVEPYKNGRIQATTDIYTGGLTQCYVDFLADFQVRATLVVPILQGQALWGLLVANHCSAPRQWQQLEIDLLKQLATQVAIAIQQSELYQQAQTELAERQRAESRLRERAYQQAVVAALGQRALAGVDLSGLMDQAVALIAQTLEVESCKVLELLPEGKALVLRSGVGWAELVGQATVEAQADTQVGYTLVSSEPVIVEDLRSETRFSEPSLLHDHGVISGLSVIVPGQNHPFGVLSAHTVRQRTFTQDDIYFLQAIANVLATAIERDQTEQKIHRQAALLDIATDAIFVRDLEHQILFWNKGAEHLYGWQAEEALGRNVNQLLVQETPHLVEALKTVLEQGEWQGELEQITKSAQKVIVQSRWTLVREDQQRSNSILTVNTDITAKKQLEAQFLRAQRLESIGTLAGGIAHDLNNILTPILAAPQLLQIKFPEADAQSQRLLKIIETNAKRGADLVKQVLSFAQGAEGKRTVLQTKHLISEIKQIAKETFPKSIKVYTDTLPDLWTVSGDATQLHQILMNLSVNARDAMPNGGTLSISAKNLLIDQNYAQMNLDAQIGPYILIEVADTGTGMPPEIIDRIFEPFFTTKKLGEGTGLGLSTVVGIIKSHGGFVEVLSQLGKGTQFKVYLPAIQGVETQQPEDLELPPGHGEIILVVDDEVAIREVTKTSLEAYGYKVLTASDGIEAVALYAQHREKIRVVLIDMIMPSMGGPTTIRTLQKINPLVKVVAVSGLSSNGQLTEAAGNTLKAFLLKPYTAKELLGTLFKVLSS